jgi:hypothetical protein
MSEEETVTEIAEEPASHDIGYLLLHLKQGPETVYRSQQEFAGEPARGIAEA